jgi:ATP-dependent Clp protease ATP-binding subunit ClpC
MADSPPNAPKQSGPARDSAEAPQLLPPRVAPSTDLTWLAQSSEAQTGSPFDGEPAYDAVFASLARALHRRQHAHVLLVGERGVGKSTLVAELARRAAQTPSGFLAAKRFLSIDCRYVTSDEARPRLTGVLSHLAPHPHLVACLDGLAGLVNPAQGGSNAPVLFAALAQARCHLIGLLTPREYDTLAADDPEFAEFFTRVDVPEPDTATAMRLLAHFAAGLGERYRLTVDSEAVRQAVTLTANYILNDQLPAKALRVLVRGCEELDYERTQLGERREQVGEADVVRIVADVTGVPEGTLRGVAERVDYERALGEVIVGQAHAVREVATELGLIKAGMTDPTKPASVLLFLGQTGTGKTEMAKALARFYSTSKRLKVYTLGNCVEPHSVATIIGVPPGYVGSDRGGRLVTELNADPYGVFLLDEADKAHPDVLQPFLNLFDEGWVTDQRGSKGYGTRSIFVLTTNVGQRMIADMHREGKTIEEITTRMKEALSQIRHGKSDRPVFTPEFLARIKRVIVFRPLDLAAMGGIARKHVDDLKKSWASSRHKTLAVGDGLAGYVGAASYRLDDKSGGKEGGRVVRKLIADWLEVPLQKALAEDPEGYRRATTVRVEFTAPPEPEAEQPYPEPVVTVQFE